GVRHPRPDGADRARSPGARPRPPARAPEGEPRDRRGDDRRGRARRGPARRGAAPPRGLAPDLDHAERAVGDRGRLDGAAARGPSSCDPAAGQGGRVAEGAPQDVRLRIGVVRVYEFRANATIGLARTGKSLLRVPHREFDNHNGGQLQFGPDGRLYAGTGDGGSGGDPQNHAQNLSSHLGKLLRLNVDRRGAKWQTIGYGLRNPWRFSWDRATRDLYIGDVGQDAWEEVDVRTPAQQGSLNNYGWRVWEGRSRYTSGQRTN